MENKPKKPRKPRAAKEAPPPPIGLASEQQLAELVELVTCYPAAFTRRERAKALLNFARQPEAVAGAFLAKVQERVTDWVNDPAAYWTLRHENDGSRPDYLLDFNLLSLFYD